ncbi:hypothetical protein [Roseobacter ponti]|uniref:Uncharacterized protein n=1 Tax=Roseobacter ponti TaxID=1891787 RepID=A0A858SQY4_9RHOB|nr:hypothetical protein [Roseobacter ponti]QJF51279.1 hypothetical protein G3256_08950 [Roseobacter ponti]
MKHRTARKTFLTVILVFTYTAANAQETPDRTLTWSIDGQSLSEPGQDTDQLGSSLLFTSTNHQGISHSLYLNYANGDFIDGTRSEMGDTSSFDLGYSYGRPLNDNGLSGSLSIGVGRSQGDVDRGFDPIIGVRSDSYSFGVGLLQAIPVTANSGFVLTGTLETTRYSTTVEGIKTSGTNNSFGTSVSYVSRVGLLSVASVGLAANFSSRDDADPSDGDSVDLIGGYTYIPYFEAPYEFGFSASYGLTPSEQTRRSLSLFVTRNF